MALQSLQGETDAAKVQMAEFQIQLLEGELTKTEEDQTPSANTIIQIGDWLLDKLFFGTGSIGVLDTDGILARSSQ